MLGNKYTPHHTHKKPHLLFLSLWNSGLAGTLRGWRGDAQNTDLPPGGRFPVKLMKLKLQGPSHSPGHLLKLWEEP